MSNQIGKVAMEHNVPQLNAVGDLKHGFINLKQSNNGTRKLEFRQNCQ